MSTLGALEALLIESQIPTLIVTHDRWFLDRVATSILAFEGAGEITSYAGNFQLYLEHRAAAEQAHGQEAPAEKLPSVKPAAREPTAESPKTKRKGLSWYEQQRLEALPSQIDGAEGTIKELEERLADPSLYAQGQASGEAAAVHAKLAAARAELEALMIEWETLEERAAATS